MNLILLDGIGKHHRLTRADQRYQHVARVLRVRNGDTVRVGVPDGPEGTATIVSFDRSAVELAVEWNAPPRRKLPIDVIIGHPRPPVLQRLFRDLATIGVRSIHVFTGDLGERSYRESSVWRNVESRLREGVSQGRHTRMPEVCSYNALDAIFDEVDILRYRYFGSFTRENAIGFPNALGEIIRENDRSSGVQLCVGPERGLTAREETVLIDHGFLPVSLGDTVLRTETAAVTLTVGIATAIGRTATDDYNYLGVKRYIQKGKGR